MTAYDKVRPKEDIGGYRKGSFGIIVELYEQQYAYLEMIDENGKTIGMLYDVPVSLLETE